MPYFAMKIEMDANWRCIPETMGRYMFVVVAIRNLLVFE